MANVQFQVGWYYLFLGIVLGNWIARIPDIKENNDLSNTMFGVALFFGALGAIASLPIVAKLNEFYGSAFSLVSGSTLLVIILPVVGLSRYKLLSLIPALFIVGFAMAMIDVSMVAQVVLLEKRNQVTQMGIYGAINAGGSMIGVLTGGALSFLSPFRHICIISAVCAPISFICYWSLIGQEEEESILHDDICLDTDDTSSSAYKPLLRGDADAIGSVIPSNQSLSSSASNSTVSARLTPGKREDIYRLEAGVFMRYLCAVGFFAQISIGTLTDWSTIYFHDELEASSLRSALGYASFSLFTAVGCVISDYLGHSYSRKTILKLSGIVSTIGVAAIIIAYRIPFPVYIATIGSAIAGLGLSLVLPVVQSAAGDVPHTRPSDAIAIITSVSYVGFLIGPPFFGGISDLLGGLHWSFLFVLGFTVLVTILPGRPPASRMHRYGLHLLSQDDSIHYPIQNSADYGCDSDALCDSSGTNSRGVADDDSFVGLSSSANSLADSLTRRSYPAF